MFALINAISRTSIRLEGWKALKPFDLQEPCSCLLLCVRLSIFLNWWLWLVNFSTIPPNCIVSFSLALWKVSLKSFTVSLKPDHLWVIYVSTLISGQPLNPLELIPRSLSNLATLLHLYCKHICLLPGIWILNIRALKRQFLYGSALLPEVNFSAFLWFCELPCIPPAHRARTSYQLVFDWS